MAKKNARNTRGKIVEAAWQLFYEQGYEDTTVEEIIESSHTSKGSFYHYFDGKDALLSTLSDLFDQKYLALQEAMDPAMPAMDKLLFLNRALFRMIENSVSMGKGTCWTTSASTTACCVGSLPRDRPRASSPRGAASTTW